MKYGYKTLLVLALIHLSGCSTSTSYDIGWSHTCTLICTNASTGQQEEIQRTGKNKNGVAICKETKVTCDAGRSAACVNTANWTNNNEPLYSGCTSVSYSDCTRGCARN